MRTLKIKSLGKSYVDKDTLMLHACFQILVDFVNEERPSIKENQEPIIDNGFNLNLEPALPIKTLNKNNEFQSADTIEQEIKFLYNWWIEKIENENNEIYDDDNLKDKEMLHRLINIYDTLWT